MGFGFTYSITVQFIYTLRDLRFSRFSQETNYICYEPAQLELFEIFHLKMNCKLQNPFQIATHKAKVLLGMVLLKNVAWIKIL